MKLFHRIVMLSLALLVLVSSTGLSVGMHFCADEVRELSLLGQAGDCPMEQKRETLPSCHGSDREQSPPGNCCEEHQLKVECLDAASDTKPFALSKALDLKFIAAVKVALLQLFAAQEELKPAYALYTSPSVARDIPVLVRSLLI